VYVLHHEALSWEMDLSKHIHATIPNLLGQMNLQYLLNLRASVLFQQSRTNDATKNLEASWKINQHLLQRPELISYLIALAVSRLQAGNLRQIPVEYGTWHPRLTDSRIHNQFWSVMEYEVWAMVKGAKEGALLDERNEKRTVMNQILAPYVRSMILDYAEVKLQFLADLKKREPCSSKKVIEDYNEIKKLFPKWNRIGPTAFTDPAGSWNREARLRLDLELTDKILLVKKINSLKNQETFNSEICPGQTWNYVRENNSYSISFSKKIDWSKGGGMPKGSLILPPTYKSPK
jgi:hypothetical protein